MTKEKIKTFVKDHKREIIIVATAIAGTACAIIGIKKIKICRNQIKSCKEEIKRKNRWIDSEGNIMEIKKFIAFGNDVKEKI